MPLSCGQYKTMDSAPTDGSVILVLTDSKYPRAAFWDPVEAEWVFWHADDACFPKYWADLPADAPSGFLEADVVNTIARTVQYQPIATAELTDDPRVLVLVDPETDPVMAYYDAEWKADSDDSAITPAYWAPLPNLPDDYPA